GSPRVALTTASIAAATSFGFSSASEWPFFSATTWTPCRDRAASRSCAQPQDMSHPGFGDLVEPLCSKDRRFSLGEDLSALGPVRFLSKLGFVHRQHA